MAVGTAERRRIKLQLLTIQHDKLQLQHSDTSSQLQEATDQVTGLAQERDQLVEQLTKFQQENMRLEMIRQGKAENVVKMQEMLEDCRLLVDGTKPSCWWSARVTRWRPAARQTSCTAGPAGSSAPTAPSKLRLQIGTTLPR